MLIPSNEPQGSNDVGPGAHRPILIIGLDGTRWDLVQRDGVGDVLPRLAEEGRFSTITMEVPTISGPGWASLLTGASHAEHGIVDNTMVGSHHWAYPDVLSLAFHRDTTTRTFAAAGWPVLIDPAGLGPILHPREDQQKAGLHRIVARDGETHGYIATDAECVAYAHAALRGPAFDTGFVYCCDVDDAGHVYGAVSDEYADAIRRVDAHVQTLVEDIQFRYDTFDEDWLVVITTDHGHVDAGGHGGDSPEERASWAIAWAPSGTLPDWPEELEPTQLTPLILEARYG
ncbi:alkaline phosphatase family protein [Corynebacterium sp. CCUG 70398]|uniref:alkaline phosphatase family protein n=1 Tax=Corynebacterium sp. CCUG 70398 TaxID=2823891 RepID=UPI002108C1E6|nr:alkaline phosphatase family protein [Corynebacterium sp. CCUG 70398]MCQ4622292.1 alkaline phosphatase family protein [Corynebacterium sp. CCUG 70398]